MNILKSLPVALIALSLASCTQEEVAPTVNLTAAAPIEDELNAEWRAFVEDDCTSVLSEFVEMQAILFKIGDNFTAAGTIQPGYLTIDPSDSTFCSSYVYGECQVDYQPFIDAYGNLNITVPMDGQPQTTTFYTNDGGDTWRYNLQSAAGLTYQIICLPICD
jgi:hypothetical protein